MAYGRERLYGLDLSIDNYGTFGTGTKKQKCVDEPKQRTRVQLTVQLHTLKLYTGFEHTTSD